MGARPMVDLATATARLAGASARERTLPLHAALTGLVPSGTLQRGSVVACGGIGATSLAFAVAAGPSQAGAWVGVAGFAGFGLAAAVTAGIAAERLAMVRTPAEGFRDGQWGEVLAAMIDGFDVLVLGPDVERMRPATIRRVQARLQARGSVAVVVAAPAFGADLQLVASGARWDGLGEGHGVATGRYSAVELSGRRVPRARRAEMWLPAADGIPAASEPSAGVAELVVPPVQHRAG